MNLKVPPVFMVVLFVVVIGSRSSFGAKEKRLPRACYLLDKIPVQQKFNLDKFQGTWYTVARTTDVFGDDTYESPSTEITKHEDDTYSYSYTGMESGGQCVPVETGSLETTNRTGVLKRIRPGGSSNDYVTMIVSFTDYFNMAMVYYCFIYKHGGKYECSPDGIHVEIMSRFENPDQDLLKHYIRLTQRRLCVNSIRLVTTKPGLCKIPELLAEAEKGEVDVSNKNDDSKPDKCAVDNIPAQENFDLQEFSGTWYTVARTTELFGENSYESPSKEITKREDDTYSYSYTGMESGGKCAPVETGSLEPTYRTGELKLIQPGGSSDNFVTMIVSFTDYNSMAMVYYCFIYIQGRKHECAPDGIHVEIMSRSENPDPDLLNSYITLVQRRLCVNSKRLVTTKPGLCKIRDLLAAAKKSDIEVSKGNDDTKPDKCSVDDIPVQENFDLQQFTGTWYTVARTTEMFGDDTYESPSTEISKHEDDTYSYSYTGLSGDKCVPVETGSLKPTKRAGVLKRIRPGGSSNDHVTMIVSFTDYKNLAMVYYCFIYKQGDQKDCESDGIHVEIMSRSEHPDQVLLNSYIDLTQQRLCVNSKRLIITKPGLCKIPDLLAAAKKEEIDVSNEREERRHCSLKDIKAEVDYNYTMLTGTWYLFASITHSKHKLSGVVIENLVSGNEGPLQSRIFAQDIHNNSLCTEYKSTAREMCLGEGSHIVTPPVGNVGNFYFSKILHVTDDFFIEYKCTKRNLDGTCDHSGAELHVYTRHVPLPKQDHVDNNDNDSADNGEDYGADSPDDDEIDDVANDNDEDSVEEDDNDAMFEKLQQDILDMILPLARNVCLNPNDLKHETANFLWGVKQSHWVVITDYPDDDEIDDVVNDDDDNVEEEDNDALLEKLPQDILDIIPPLARNVCLNPNDIRYETAWCSPPETNINYTEAVCDIDLAYNIMGDYDDLKSADVRGYWYEVARSRGISFLGRTGRLSAYFNTASNSADALKLLYSGLQQDGEYTACSDVQSTTLMKRCAPQPVADYLALFNKTDDQITYIPYKIVYTDGVSFMLTLVCEFVDAEGNCADGSAFTRVWSRNMSVTRKEIENVLVYGESVCLHNNLDDFIYFTDADYSCMEGLKYYVKEKLPNPPLNLGLTNIQARSVLLQFIPGHVGNTSVTTWIVEALEEKTSAEYKQVYQTIDSDTTSITVKNLRPYTYYRLRLIAENSIGRSSASEPTTWFQTLQDAPTNPPGNVTVRALNATSLSISWTPLLTKEWNGIPIGYKIYYRMRGSSIFTLIDLDDPTNMDNTILTELKEGTKYELQMLAYNEVGNSDRSPILIGRTRASDE